MTSSRCTCGCSYIKPRIRTGCPWCCAWRGYDEDAAKPTDPMSVLVPTTRQARVVAHLLRRMTALRGWRG
jgi:hypothetical protein